MNKPSRGATAATVAILLAAALAGCDSPPPVSDPQEQAQQVAQNRENYIPKNDVEGRNYNARQRIADDPATLIWCTTYPTSPNAKAFTVPIVGKLTSGNKRPFPTQQTLIDTDTADRWYSPELPSSDGFFGTSGEYRYGFDPAGNYHEFYNLETYCTTVPNVIQKEETRIAIGVAGDLNTIDAQVQAALKACVDKAPKDKSGAPLYDPSKSCPEAARLLGVSQ